MGIIHSSLIHNMYMVFKLGLLISGKNIAPSIATEEPYYLLEEKKGRSYI